MNIALPIPEEVARILEQRWGDLSRRALEAVAAEAYREGVLTSAEVGRMLGFSSRWETEASLKHAAAQPDYTEADLRQDPAALRRAADDSLRNLECG